MPYANLNEAFNTYAEGFDYNASMDSSRDIRNELNDDFDDVRPRIVKVPNQMNQIKQIKSNCCNHRRQYGGQTTDSRNISKLQTTFNINSTDPADDVPNIATNNINDGFNVKYSSLNEWNVLDPNGVNPPINKTIAQSPDRIMNDQIYQPTTQQRTSMDRIWDRPTSSEVDTYRLNQSAAIKGTDPYGGIGTAPRITGTTPGTTPGTTSGTIPTSDKDNTMTLTGDMCSDDNCMTMINHIMKCDSCVQKFRKLLGVETSTKILGMEIPEINMTKLMFWVILIILIVAVYELMNSIFKRFFI